jgi:hypothetical protein
MRFKTERIKFVCDRCSCHAYKDTEICIDTSSGYATELPEGWRTHREIKQAHRTIDGYNVVSFNYNNYVLSKYNNYSTSTTTFSVDGVPLDNYPSFSSYGLDAYKIYCEYCSEKLEALNIYK